jgi:hypothetical protein
MNNQMNAARHGPQPKSEKGELNRQAQSRQEDNPRVLNRGFRWFNSALLGHLAVQLDSIRMPRKFAQPAQIPTGCGTDGEEKKLKP